MKLGNFKNFDKLNESISNGNAVLYTWGQYSEDDDISGEELLDMVRLTPDMLEGFDIRPEDKDIMFYAYDIDIDDTNVDEEGYGIKHAWGIKLDQDKLKLVQDILDNAGSYCMDNKDDKNSFVTWLNDNLPKYKGIDVETAVGVVQTNTSCCTDNEDDVKDLVSIISNL